MRIIRDEADITEGLAALARLCPHAASMAAAVPDVPLRRWPTGFAGLMRIIISQQVSVSSAAAIRGRVEALLGETTAAAYLLATPEALRAAGLSASKIRTLTALAQAIEEGKLPLHGPDARAHLMAVSGIGPWTADVFELFCTGNADAFAAGDLALQEAARQGFALDARPTPAQLTALVAHWVPWRGVGARLLWAYYAALKARQGIAP